MTFRDWQQRSPADAAREVHRRVAALPEAQRRAVFATLADEATLAAAFAHTPRSAALGGVPVVVKDLFDVAGAPTFAGSTFLPEERPSGSRDAALVTMLRTVGAVIAGKTHLHEFAYGITGENPHHGDVDHPRFPGRTSGGSSSGSAAAVAAGIVPLALGTDTGGSVRVPAAFCGLYGFRLQPGETWIRDAFPLAPTFDTAGWFTADAADMRAAIAALVGVRTTPAPLRGIYLDYGELDPEVATACREAAARLAPAADADTAATLRHGFAPALDAYTTIVAHEAWQSHERWAAHRRERYDPAVWTRLTRGRDQPPRDIEVAHVALAAVRLLWAKFFLAYDFLVLPASPCAALTKADCTPANRARLIALTAPASLGGLPVLTVPVALPGGLSTGLQIVVPHRHSPAIAWVLEQMQSVTANGRE